MFILESSFWLIKTAFNPSFRSTKKKIKVMRTPRTALWERHRAGIFVDARILHAVYQTQNYLFVLWSRRGPITSWNPYNKNESLYATTSICSGPVCDEETCPFDLKW